MVAPFFFSKCWSLILTRICHPSIAHPILPSYIYTMHVCPCHYHAHMPMPMSLPCTYVHAITMHVCPCPCHYHTRRPMPISTGLKKNSYNDMDFFSCRCKNEQVVDKNNCKSITFWDMSSRKICAYRCNMCFCQIHACFFVN